MSSNKLNHVNVWGPIQKLKKSLLQFIMIFEMVNFNHSTIKERAFLIYVNLGDKKTKDKRRLKDRKKMCYKYIVYI